MNISDLYQSITKSGAKIGYHHCYRVKHSIRIEDSNKILINVVDHLLN